MRLTTLVRSRRRSSVSAGMGMRTNSPSDCGLTPSSDLRTASSIAGHSFFSHGLMTIKRASGVDSDATWLSGVGVP